MDDKIFAVTFLPYRKTINVTQNSTILQAVALNLPSIEAVCNGTGVCGKCLVKATGMLSTPSDQEKEKLGVKLAEGWRLACQARVNGLVEVLLPEKQTFVTVLNGKAKKYKFSPPIKRILAANATDLNTAGRLYGVAIDIGTTSIVASLIDLRDEGKEIGSAHCLNPQSRFGADVITRITYAHQSEDNLGQLRETVLEGINNLIEDTCRQQQVKVNDIYHVTIAGNTTMLHLVLGIDPISLAVAPYTPVFIDYRELQALAVGLKAPKAVISLLPSLSAFVGADILAGMIAIDFHKVTVPSLFIDIGTNGEIVANVNGRLVATSSAAGPALEGMNIQHGCRAEAGAISCVRITTDSVIRLEIIGSVPPQGICGSGLVELVAELLKHKVILDNGSFGQPADLPTSLAQRIIEVNGQKAFVVDQESGIVLTQKDIRQVQLAKGAIAAAIEILFQRLEADLGAVEKVYIAGAFGYHLNPEALRTIGLLPPGLKGEIEFVGNTAKEGARLCLSSEPAFDEIQALQQALDPLELSYAPDFMDKYIEHMNFPYVPDDHEY